MSLRTTQSSSALPVDNRRVGPLQRRRKRRRQRKQRDLVKALCNFNKCGPIRLPMMLRQRKIENLKFLSDFKLETIHLKRNVYVTPDSISSHGSRHVFAYRGFLGITVEQHLYARHRVRLRYPFLQCIIHYGGNGHFYSFPIELLQISHETDI